MSSPLTNTRAAAASGGREVARWIARFARFGYAAKGVVYAVVGVLAVRLAFGRGGEATGSRGALREIGQAPFGRVLLVLLALGLLAYAAWKVVEGVLDVENHGSEPKGMVVRTAYVASGALHAALALFAVSLAVGHRGAARAAAHAASPPS